MRRRLLLSLVPVLAALAAGCGNARTPPPDPYTPGPPLGFSDAAYPDAGIAFRMPGGWRQLAGQAPQVATVSTGTAAMALWRYPRSQPLPEGEEGLEAARTALEEAARARDGSLEIQESRVTELDGEPAVELVGVETIAGRKRMVRSVHAYAFGAEVVVDAYARPEDFARVNDLVFSPVIDSFELSEPEA